MSEQSSRTYLTLERSSTLESIVVEIRDSTLALVGRYFADDSPIPLAPGLYLAKAFLPDGDVWVDYASLEPGDSKRLSVPLSANEDDEHVLARWQPSFDDAKVNFSFAFDRDTHFYTFDSLDKISQAPSVSLKLETTRFPTTTFWVTVPQGFPNRVLIAQVAPREEIPINVVLPLGGAGTTCRVHVTSTTSGVVVRTSLDDPDIDLALRYLLHGLHSEALQAAERRKPRPDVQAVAAVAWHLIRLQAAGMLLDESAVNELLELNPWMPDASILAAEVAITTGNQSEALRRLQALRTLGLPIFADSFALAVARLGHLSRSESPFIRESSENLYSSLVKWSTFIEAGASSVAVPGYDLSDPAGSLAPRPEPAVVGR